MLEEIPEEIKNIIEKTANFVARLGDDFEKRITQNELNNPKFSFLHPNGEYADYYQQRVAFFLTSLGKPVPEERMIRDQNDFMKLSENNNNNSVPVKTERKINSIDDIDEDMPTAPAPQSVPIATTTIQPAKKGPTSLAQILLSVTQKLKGKDLSALPDMFLADLPPDLTATDLDVIKLTAQFVARNGHQFQVGLMNREHKNPQFEFLKQNHPWNPFYLILVESYTRCLLPPKNYVTKLKEQYSEKRSILNYVIEKYEAQKQQKIKKQLEDQKEIEQQLNVQINWHEFVVVETIDFLDEEIVPPQTGAQEKTRATTPSADEMETDMEVEEDQPKPQQSKIELKVRKDYVRSANPLKRGPIQYQVCPKCGQQVPIEEMQEHLRQELLNQTQQSRPEVKASIAPDSDISKNLQKFAQRRTDIFGEEETDIGKTIAREPSVKKEEAPKSWDGSIIRPPVPFQPPPPAVGLPLDPMTGLPIVTPVPQETTALLPTPVPSIPLPTPPLPFGVARPSIPLPPPIASGLMRPPVPVGYPHMMGMQHPTPTFSTMSPSLIEPPPKKQKLNEEESKLIPEEEFLQTHGSGPITVKVQIPLDDKVDNFKGQTLTFDVDLKISVNDLKEKIKGETGFAANKQKLKVDPVGVLKDTNTLAFYNFKDGTTLQLEKKERGGKSTKKK